MTIKALRPGAEVLIGSDVGMSGCSVCAFERVVIGDRVLIGSGALITDNDAHALDPSERNDPSRIGVRPVVVEEDVFIGARAIVLKGVRVGHGSVVGAGAVVSRDVPAMCVVAGNPARVVRTLTCE